MFWIAGLLLCGCLFSFLGVIDYDLLMGLVAWLLFWVGVLQFAFFGGYGSSRFGVILVLLCGFRLTCLLVS